MHYNYVYIAYNRYVSWDRLQRPATLMRISGMDNGIIDMGVRESVTIFYISAFFFKRTSSVRRKEVLSDE